MLIKTDIEKAYDTLRWNIAIFSNMGFPTLWISWVKTCLSSNRFSFLINGQPSNWISSARGIRQGVHLSLYMFIFASQNLTVILNKALSLDLVPSFNPNLALNFNHLMYANDLNLVTRANRKSARKCKLCLDIYAHLTGQISNSSKSTIYFPS